VLAVVGVTLVVGVVGVVGVGVIFFTLDRYTKRSQVKVTQLKVRRVLDAVQEWKADPDVQKKGDADCKGSLSELVPDLFKEDMIKDGWNNKLKLTCQGTQICVYSYG
jgi:hypothetical protein